MSMSNIKVEDFTNHLEQVIKPNSKIVVVTKGYGNSVAARMGTYLGTRNGNACVIVMSSRWNRSLKKQEPVLRRQTLQRNMIYPAI